MSQEALSPLYSSISALIKAIGYSRASFYRKVSSGELQPIHDPLKGWFLKDFKPKVDLSKFESWLVSGEDIPPISESYRSTTLYMVRQFFRENPVLTLDTAKAWVFEPDASRFSMRKHRHSALSLYVRYMCLTGQGSETLLQGIRKLYPKKGWSYTPKQTTVTQKELQRLLQEALKGHRRYDALLNHTLLRFISETGLRASEVGALQMGDLHFGDNPKTAFVVVSKGKGNKKRLVPFSRAAQATCQDYLQVRPTEYGETVFIAWNPKQGYRPLTKDCLARRFKALSERVGIEFSAHSLRRYRITQWANDPRIPITATQKWAGHSDLKVTQEYIHLRDEDALRAAYE